MVEYPEWFTIKSPVEKKNVIETDMRVVPGTCDKDGRFIYIVKVGKFGINTTK